MWVILQRELLIRGRSWGTWAVRMLVTVAALAVIGLFFLISAILPGGPAQSGEFVFYVLFYGLMVFSLFEGIRTSALGITEEKQDGTLGLLFLTPLSSFDVLLGKFSGAAVTSLYGLVAVTPLLALPLLLGGVTFGEVFRAAIVLLGTLGMSLACGLIGSVRSRDGIGAVMRASCWLIGCLLAPLVAELLLQWLVWKSFSSALSPLGAVSPVYAMGLARSVSYSGAPDTFWLAQLGLNLLSLALVAVAARRLKRTWRIDETRKPAVAKPNSPKARIKPQSSLETLAGVVARRARSRTWFWSFLGLTLFANLSGLLGQGRFVASLFTVIFLPLMIAGLASTVVLIYVACRTYSEARQTGEIEILLTTPVDDRDVVRTLWLALRPFVVWGTVLVGAIHVAGVVIAFVSNADNEYAFRMLGSALGAFVTGTVSSALGLAAYVWVGMWMGLTARKISGAVGMTFLLVVVATSIGLWFVQIPIQIWLQYRFVSTWSPNSGTNPYFDLLMGLLQSLVSAVPYAVAYLLWIRWARNRLYSRFRTEASRSESVARHWVIPHPAPPALPPAASA